MCTNTTSSYNLVVFPFFVFFIYCVDSPVWNIEVRVMSVIQILYSHHHGNLSSPQYPVTTDWEQLNQSTKRSGLGG